MRILYLLIISTYFLFISSCNSSKTQDHSAEEATHEHESESTSEDANEASEHNHENVKQQMLPTQMNLNSLPRLIHLYRAKKVQFLLTSHT